MSKGGSAPAGNTTTTQVSQPWSGVVPYLTSGLQSASNLYAQGGPQYFPGQTYAPENSAEQQGIAGLQGIESQFSPLLASAQGGVTNAINTGQNVGTQAGSIFGDSQSIAGQTAANNPSNSFFSGLASGSTSTPGVGTLQNFSSGADLSANNPYFQQMANTVTANVLPGINAQFANAGRGNSGLAANAAGQGLGNAIGGLAYNNYQQGLAQQQSAADTLAGLSTQGAQGLGTNYQNSISNQLNAANLGLNAGGQQIAGANLGLLAANLAPELQAMGINANNAGLAAGQTQQSLDQMPITAAMNQWNYNQNLPYANLQNYISNITGQNAGGGTSATTSPYFQNSTANALSGVLGTSMIGNQLLGSNSGGLFSSLGSLFGSTGGAAAGAGDMSSLFDAADMAALFA